MASFGQQSCRRVWKERIIYYDRYHDRTDSILERTVIMCNAKKEDTDMLMPLSGTRYSTFRDFIIS